MNWSRLFFQATAYFKYYAKAGDAHSIHSPFVFDFYNQVLKKQEKEPEIRLIEQLRQELQYSQEQIEVTDLGAGNTLGAKKMRSIAQIIQNTAKTPHYANILYHLACKQQPKTIVELGTSLGLTTAYLAKAAPNATIYTMEGCPNTAEKAQQNWKKLAINNIKIIVGNIDETLPQLLPQLDVIDLLFADANHRYEPTMRYITACMQKKNSYSVFVLDDIHWSEEMQNAWNELRKQPSVITDIDIFQLGFLFFNPIHPKQSFTIK
jgi:predicted O-methyltransferase YrrM